MINHIQQSAIDFLPRRKSLSGTGPKPASVMIVGEFPFPQDLSNDAVFSGNDGDELSKLLQKVGINRGECYLTNVIKVSPNGNMHEEFFLDKKCTKPNSVLESYIRELEAEVSEVNPRMVIALGKIALLALTGQVDLSQCRGSRLRTLPQFGNRKCIPTHHPAATKHNWELKPLVREDFRHAAYEAQSIEDKWLTPGEYS